MPKDRSLGRNVHIYSAGDTSTVIGGLVVTDGMTNSNFYSMLEITYILNRGYRLRYEGGTIVNRDDNPLQPGKYFISTADSLMTNNEPWLVRTGKVPVGICTAAFRDAVCKRDRRCVITGVRPINAAHELWSAYEATHIFPLEHAKHWVDPCYDRRITTPTSRRSLNSVQNGLFLRLDIREWFERYLVSINPDVSTQVYSSEF